MRLFQKRFVRLGAGFALALSLSMMLATSAFATPPSAGTTAEVDLSGGALAVAVTAPTAANATMTETGATTTYDLPVTVGDPTMTDAGWTLSMKSTQFTGTDQTTPIGSSSITSSGDIAVACTVASPASCITSTPSATITYPVNLTTSYQAIYDADANTGEGETTVTPTVHVTLPFNVAHPVGTPSETLTATVTVSLASGPNA